MLGFLFCISSACLRMYLNLLKGKRENLGLRASPNVNALGVKFWCVKLCNFRRILLSFYIELPKVSEGGFDVLKPLILLGF